MGDNMKSDDKRDAIKSVAKYTAKGVASGFLLYFMPDIARASGHGGMTLVFGVVAIFMIWAS